MFSELGRRRFGLFRGRVVTIAVGFAGGVGVVSARGSVGAGAGGLGLAWARADGRRGTGGGRGRPR